MLAGLRRMSTLVVFASAVMVAFAVQAKTKPEDAVRAADQEWARVFNAKQLDASVDACAATARVYAPNAPAAVGHDQIKQLFAGFFSLPELDVKWTPDEVRVAESGDLAYTTGKYEMSFVADGKPIKDHGKYVTIWRREGAAWKVLVDSFNSDLPAAGAESR